MILSVLTIFCIVKLLSSFSCFRRWK